MEYIKNVAKIKIDLDKCVGCALCVDVCPHAVIEIMQGAAFLANKDRCIECGACGKNCPEHAIEVVTGAGCAYAILNTWFKSDKNSCC